VAADDGRVHRHNRRAPIVTSPMKRRLLLLPAVFVLVAACGVAATPSPAAPAMEPLVPALTVDHPTVVVIPASHLRDGQAVEVRVTGFGVGGEVRLSECASAADASGLGCGAQPAAQTLLVTDESRAGHASFTVSATAPVGSLLATPVEPCADQCVIVATLGAGYTYVVAPIAFGDS
jgi:hypothetical protein